MTTLDFSTLIRKQITTIQTACVTVLDFTVGSVIRAIIESNATLTIYLSGLILDLLATTRASTSYDTDLDTWMGDYNLVRMSASSATGQVTFSRFTPSAVAFIPVGVTVENTDGSQIYTVVADASDPNYDVDSASYSVQVGVVGISIPVAAVAVGSNANAVIGGINIITQVISGIDTVTNELAFTNGVDAEDDDAFRARFIRYISSLARATMGAVVHAITSTQVGVSCVVVENYTYIGDLSEGFFYAVVDDGSGTPSTDLLNAVTASVEAVRPMGSTFAIYAPIVMYADVSATIIVSGTDGVAIKASVVVAITDYLNTLALGVTCPYTILSQIIYNVSPSITNVTGITLNGDTIDIIISNHQIIKSGTVTIL